MVLVSLMLVIERGIVVCVLFYLVIGDSFELGEILLSLSVVFEHLVD